MPKLKDSLVIVGLWGLVLVMFWVPIATALRLFGVIEWSWWIVLWPVVLIFGATWAAAVVSLVLWPFVRAFRRKR